MGGCRLHAQRPDFGQKGTVPFVHNHQIHKALVELGHPQGADRLSNSESRAAGPLMASPTMGLMAGYLAGCVFQSLANPRHRQNGADADRDCWAQ